MADGWPNSEFAPYTDRARIGNNRRMLALIAAISLVQQDNTLTNLEKHAGWRLLFDGKTTNGWHNWKAKGVKPGWKVENGVLSCTDPENASDIVTDEQYDWFELTLDVNLGKDQNSGIMFRVTEEGEAPWHSGPEIQIYDHKIEPGVEVTGFLYQLYGSTVDASKPAGEWNHLRILVSPKICQTDVNGVKYYEYVWGSDDFWARVKKSKFSKFPFFAKAAKGAIGIQGDHGKVSFKNIKIRPIKP